MPRGAARCCGVKQVPFKTSERIVGGCPGPGELGTRGTRKWDDTLMQMNWLECADARVSLARAPFLTPFKLRLWFRPNLRQVKTWARTLPIYTRICKLLLFLGFVPCYVSLVSAHSFPCFLVDPRKPWRERVRERGGEFFVSVCRVEHSPLVKSLIKLLNSFGQS